MVGTGIDCINPLEPVANMDVAEVKQKYGGRIAIMGNIDCGDLLCNGSEEDVEAAVKECIRKGAPGGGLIISSSNSIHSGVDPRNYEVMIRTAKKYGKYPLQVEGKTKEFNGSSY
jgi:uroporphyrinogen decarboxylase